MPGGFVPWIGSGYGEQSLKIMVLGESHHDDKKTEEVQPDEKEKHCTESLTRQYVEGKFRHEFWSKVGELVSRFAGWNELRHPRDTFQRIAFYNFADSFVTHHRTSPSRECVLRSRRNFVDVLGKYAPDFVVALGVRRQPWFLTNIPELTYVATQKPFVALFHKTPIVVCNHPQGRFSYEEALGQLRQGRQLAEKYA